MRNIVRFKAKRALTIPLVVSVVLAATTARAEPMTLERVLALVNEAPRAHVARARAVASRAGVRTANKLLRHNPTLRGSLETDAPFDNDGERSLGVAIEQAFELGGQQGLRRDLAGAESDEGAASSAGAVADLKTEVVARFFEVDTLARELAVGRQVAEVYRRLSVSAAALVERGAITRIDLAVIDLEKTRVEAQLARDSGWLEAESRELASLAGRPTLAIEPVTSDAVAPLAASADALVADAVVRRPELAATRHRQRGATAKESLALREVWLTPTVAVGVKQERLVFGRGGLRLDAGAAPGLNGVDHRMWVAAVDLSIPLPVFEQRNTDRARAQGELAIASAEELATRDRIEGEVRAAAARADAAWRAFEISSTTRTVAEETSALVESAFARGAVTVNEVLVAHERILRARLGVVRARGDVLRARAVLAGARGHWSGEPSRIPAGL